MLQIEDNPDDAILIATTLQRAGYNVVWERVDGAAELEAALQRDWWDVITCDYIIPGFGAAPALALLREKRIEVPVLIVTGAVAEDVAVSMMKAGACDFITKENLARLAPAIERELRESAARQARHHAEIALFHSQQRLQSVISNARFPIFAVDISGRITSWNPAAERVFGWRGSDILGKSCTLLDSRGLDPLYDLRERVATGEEVGGSSVRLRTRVGATIDFRISLAPIRTADGVLAEFSVILGDDCEQGANLRIEDLEAANRELDAFSYSVSHDLRAPLRRIEDFSQLLLDEYADHLDHQGRHYVKRIHAGANRMNALIRDLLSLSRVARDQLLVASVDLTSVAREIAAELCGSDRSRQVEFAIADGLVVEGDPHLLRVALQNLLDNAWKYSSKKPTARIEVGAFAVDGEVVYYVRDDGAGFDMSYVDKLFAPFRRLHSESEFEGTGIGLATVQRIVHRHHGRVWAEAAPDKGATFFFTLATPTACAVENVVESA